LTSLAEWETAKEYMLYSGETTTAWETTNGYIERGEYTKGVYPAVDGMIDALPNRVPTFDTFEVLAMQRELKAAEANAVTAEPDLADMGCPRCCRQTARHCQCSESDDY
jgi:hypothetical protein